MLIAGIEGGPTLLWGTAAGVAMGWGWGCEGGGWWVQ